ncbi:Homoserine O-acetyltransferase [Frankia canadensis]|uniref:Homoserine O-acetyltransferase n=1 Tax=Frankia canadensis TaxID=1836972 RepID=A0A2I2KJY8_9ACTN|nr:homoserine O-acetyltransferase [Frankia canadensis]SNQ45964.1 Homoserine O-acetyltransferase [Frankia canadensis]SOU53254.1 Homoserine O-acetyltransferase [Frankia canadensis]
MSGAWRPGIDLAGQRRFARLPGPLRLERGGALPDVQVAYETWGRLDASAGNAVLVLHALTGDSHAAGPAGPGHPSTGWWDELVGPGRVLDTDRLYVVAPNVLGGCQGTTGPSSLRADGMPWGGRWPDITIGDQVAAEAALADLLGIRRWAAVVGGSMGGMRALEWAVGHPDRVARAVVLACGAVSTAEQIGLCAVQIQAITEDPGWHRGDYHARAPGAGPDRGMALARRIAQISYRSEEELQERFGARTRADGQFEVASYLDHHAVKLARRFDAGSYVSLTRAMMTQDVGRGRGGYATALRACPVPFTLAGVDSDRLYPMRLQADIASLTGSPLRLIHSRAGHDGFLIETDQIADLLRDVLGPS